MKIAMSLILLLILASCSNTPVKIECGAKQFYADYEKWQLETFPSYASSKGVGERHNKLFKSNIENITKLHEQNKVFLAQVNALKDSKNCESEKVNLSLLSHGFKEDVDQFKFATYLIRFESMGGPHTWLPQMYKRVPLKTYQNYADYLERMAQFPEVFEEAKVLSLEGLKRGITPPKVTFKNYESSMLDLSKGSATKSPFYKPFIKMSDNLNAEQKKKIRNTASRIIVNKIQPSYQALHKFWTEDYYPYLRTTIAASALPQGKEYYDFQVRKMTTLDITAKEVHEKGKSEVARILSEMNEIQKKVKFQGSFKAFLKHLRSDPKFYAKTSEELMQRTALILKTIDGKIPKLFKTMPMLPYGLEPIPEYIAHKSPAAYYQRGNLELGRSGRYQLNLSDLKSRPLYNLVALSLHEAVPGHHLQIAIAQELKGLPDFRKDGGPTAFIEGWGLYSESLGKDVGMYEDPYDDFGRLNYEQWRAMRLVVDTGIHAFNWTRDQAINYMKENSGLSEKNIITEVDRYINWPGQALAYKMGELKITELKKRAKEALGAKFDIREFHDVVLKEGAIPLPLLESNVKSYIAKTRNN